MATKRKNQDRERTEESQFRDRKKAKIQEARQIAVQVPTHYPDGAWLEACWVLIEPIPRKVAAVSFLHP